MNPFPAYPVSDDRVLRREDVRASGGRRVPPSRFHHGQHFRHLVPVLLLHLPHCLPSLRHFQCQHLWRNSIFATEISGLCHYPDNYSDARTDMPSGNVHVRLSSELLQPRWAGDPSDRPVSFLTDCSTVSCSLQQPHYAHYGQSRNALFTFHFDDLQTISRLLQEHPLFVLQKTKRTGKIDYFRSHCDTESQGYKWHESWEFIIVSINEILQESCFPEVRCHCNITSVARWLIYRRTVSFEKRYFGNQEVSVGIVLHEDHDCTRNRGSDEHCVGEQG